MDYNNLLKKHIYGLDSLTKLAILPSKARARPKRFVANQTEIWDDIDNFVAIFIVQHFRFGLMVRHFSNISTSRPSKARQDC